MGEAPFRTPESWENQPWVEVTARGRWVRQEGKRTAGLLPEESPEVKPGVGTQGPQPTVLEGEVSGLQRAIEKELMEQLQDENVQLLEEIRRLKSQNRSEEASVSQWSEVSGSQPQPPPPVTPLKNERRDVNGDLERYTPGGTKVPSGPPPKSPEREVPPWPLEGYERVDVEKVWKDFGSHHGVARVDLRDRSPRRGARSPRHGVCEGGDLRSRHGVCEGGADRSRHELCGKESNGTMADVLTSVQARAVWLERELELMKATLKNQEVVGLKSDYWKKPILHQERDEGPLSRADLGGLCGQGRALHSSGIEHGGVCEQGRAGNYSHGLSGSDRALHGTVLGVHCPLGKECGDGPGQKGDGDSWLGESHHGVCQRHQQLDGRDLCDPTVEGVGGGSKGQVNRPLEKRGDVKSPRERSPQDALRSTNPTVPPLPAVNKKHASIEAADWLEEMKPIIGDISNRASKWWEMTMSRTWEVYHVWLRSNPLQRIRINPPDPVPWQELGNEQVIKRLEQRVTTILLPALPNEVRNDLITSRQLWPCAILYKILRCYQPGGWAERSSLLTDLTATKAMKDAASAASALRLWHRQKQRAIELGDSIPDALLQVRALEMIVSLVTVKHPQSLFRISTFRMEAGLDEKPTDTSIAQFLELLTAEMDAIALGTTSVDTSSAPSAKALQLDMEGKGNKNVETTSRPCRFWGTDSGCRHGKSCKFEHAALQDQAKRCFCCSSTEHRKQDCPYKNSQPSTSTSSVGGSGFGAGAGKNGGNGKGDKNKNGKGNKPSQTGNGNGSGKGIGNGNETQDPKVAAVNSTTSTTKDDSLTSSTSKSDETQGPREETLKPTTGETELVNEVTSLLKSLRIKTAGPSVKVCQLRKLADGDRCVLLDGGATHCLRTCRDDGEWLSSKEIKVTLADGETVLRQLPNGTLITRQRVQSIVPVSLVASLGYNVTWNKKGCEMTHPKLGALPVTLSQGCPVVPEEVGEAAT